MDLFICLECKSFAISKQYNLVLTFYLWCKNEGGIVLGEVSDGWPNLTTSLVLLLPVLPLPVRSGAARVIAEEEK